MIFVRTKCARKVLLASLIAHNVFAQARERPIAQFSFAGARIEVTATPTAVRILVFRRADFVPIYLTPDEAVVWADSADRLLSATLPTPPPGEIVKYEAESDERTPKFTLIREIRGRASTYNLFFADQYIVNTALAVVSVTQARSFIKAVRRAASVSVSMADVAPTRTAERPSEETPVQDSVARDYPPTVRDLFIPPMPSPRSVRGMHVKAVFDVDEKGKSVLLSVTPIPDSGYSKRVSDVLKSLRFRPGVKADGTPKRDTTTIEFSFAGESAGSLPNGNNDADSTASGRAREVVTARSDGIEFPFPGYIDNIGRQVALNFKSKTGGGRLKAELRLLIHRNGSVSDLTFVRRSGNFSFDLEAQGAVEAASSVDAFGSLPAGFQADALPVVLNFDTGPYTDESDQRTYFEFQVEEPAEMLLDNPKPTYPSALRSSGIAGEVQVQFVVRRDGTPDMDSFKVLRATNELFTQAVKAVLPSVRFNPAKIGGKRVNQLVQQSFQFAARP
jgi:TonB family protein